MRHFDGTFVPLVRIADMRTDVTRAFEIQAITPRQLRDVTRVERRFALEKRAPSGGRVPHRRRATVKDSGGVHVTWKLMEGIPSLRQKRMFVALMRCFCAGKSRFELNLIAYTVMGNHVHLIVGPKSDDSLRRGLQGLGIRIARAINRTFGRTGKVFRERFFARALRTRRAVYYAVRYALQNARKHGVAIPAGEWDPYCSAAFHIPTANTPPHSRPIVRADFFLHPWLACALRLIQPEDLPGPRIYA